MLLKGEWKFSWELYDLIKVVSLPLRKKVQSWTTNLNTLTVVLNQCYQCYLFSDVCVHFCGVIISVFFQYILFY